jgi:hypothetical protein
MRRGSVDHRHPEHPPAQNAEQRDQLHQAFCCYQPCLLDPTARLQDLVEDFNSSRGVRTSAASRSRPRR